MSGYPLDTVKVRIQTQSISTKSSNYSGTFGTLIRIVKEEKVLERKTYSQGFIS